MVIPGHLSMSTPPLDLFSNTSLVQEGKKKWKRAGAEVVVHTLGAKTVTRVNSSLILRYAINFL